MKNIITKIVLAFTIIIAILFYIGLRVYNNGKKIYSTNQEILRSYNIISLNKDLASQAKDMALATRGFLLTEDSTYLKPYFIASEKYPQSMAKFVDALLSREESLQKKARTLARLIETRKKYSEQYVITRQEKGINSAIALFQMQRNGNKIMDSIRDITDNIEVIETGWLQNKLRAREEQYEQLSNLIFGLVGIITATLIFVIWLLSRDITGRVKAESNLMALNQNLEQQVETRTKDLKRSFEDMEVKVKFRNLELERQNLELSKRIAELEKNV